MLRTTFLMALVAVSALATIPALAQPAPSPHLEDLEIFEGFWNCNGMAFSSPFGPERPIRATINVEWTLDDFWLNSEYTERRTGKNPKPAAGHVHWGYDELTRKFTGYGVNNFGGYIKVDSDGWIGDTIIWSGTMNIGGTAFPTRDIFFRRSTREIQHRTEAQLDGQFVALNEETCRRVN